MNQTIIRRQVIDELSRYLDTDDVLILHGARQVGKTSCLMYLKQQLEQSGKPVFYFDLEDSRYLALLEKGVDEFLLHLTELGVNLDMFKTSNQKLFIMIDEVQYLQNPTSFLKLIADHHRYLKLIVSGSSSFEMKSKFRDSLVGRTISYELFPLSFKEFLIFKGVDFHPGPKMTDLRVNQLTTLYLQYCLYGGYPKIVLTPDVTTKEKYLQQIIDTYIRKDIRELAQIKEITKFNLLIEILASQSGNMLNLTELCNTCQLSLETINRYLFLLEQTYIIKLVRPFSRNLRTELTKTPKVFLYDTGLMQMLWFKSLSGNLLGSVFETSIFSELVKKYGQNSVKYWRTTDKQEIDFIIQYRDQLIPIEAKIQFPYTIPAQLNSFAEKYPQETRQTSARLVAIKGQPADDSMVYPWEII